MKKLFAIAACAAVAVSLMFAGCKTTIVDPVEAEALARNIGAAAGLVVKISGKADTNVLTQVVYIAEQVSLAIPTTNVTFVAAWDPIASNIVVQLIKDEKLDEDTGAIVKAGVHTVALATDYMFKRHPEWRESQELTSVTIRGLVEGFKSTALPASALQSAEFDVDAYNYLSAATSN